MIGEKFEGGKTVLLYKGEEIDKFDGPLAAYAAGRERYGRGNFTVRTIGLPEVPVMMTH